MRAVMKPLKGTRLEDYTDLFCTWEGGFKVWGWLGARCVLLLEDSSG